MATDEAVRKAFSDLYLIEGVKSVPKLLSRLAELGYDEVPSDRTAYRLINEMKERYTPEQQALDQPWQLRVDHPGVSNEDVRPILDCVTWAALNLDAYPNRVTFRQALWISTIWRAMQGAGTGDLCWITHNYANRERWSVIEAKQLDTTDLDEWLAFTPWRDGLHGHIYDLAKALGLVRGLDLSIFIRDSILVSLKEAEQIARDVQDKLSSIPKERIKFGRRIEAIKGGLPPASRLTFELMVKAMIRKEWPDKKVIEQAKELAADINREFKEAPNEGNAETAEQGELDHNSRHGARP